MVEKHRQAHRHALRLVLVPEAVAQTRACHPRSHFFPNSNHWRCEHAAELILLVLNTVLVKSRKYVCQADIPCSCGWNRDVAISPA